MDAPQLLQCILWKNRVSVRKKNLDVECTLSFLWQHFPGSLLTSGGEMDEAADGVQETGTQPPDHGCVEFLLDCLGAPESAGANAGALEALPDDEDDEGTATPNGNAMPNDEDVAAAAPRRSDTVDLDPHVLASPIAWSLDFMIGKSKSSLSRSSFLKTSNSHFVRVLFG